MKLFRQISITAALFMMLTIMLLTTSCTNDNEPNHPIVGEWLAYEYMDTFYIDKDMAGEPVKMVYPDDKLVDKRMKLEVRYDKKNEYYVGTMLTYDASNGKWDTFLSQEFTLTDKNKIKFPVYPFVSYSAEIYELSAEELHANIRVSGSMGLFGQMFPNISLDQLDGHRFTNIFDCRFHRTGE